MIIRRIDVWSAARLYGGISASFGLLIGLCVAVAVTLGGLTWSSGRGAGVFGALGAIGALIGAPIFYGVVGLIGAAIGAALYNLFAGVFGGIEVEVEQ